MDIQPKFKVGDHISNYSSYWGRRTGIVTESLGMIRNIDGPGKNNFGYFIQDDVTGTIAHCSEKNMKKCRVPKKSAIANNETH